MLQSLSPSNFFRYYMFHTQDNNLAKNDRCKALALSIILGIVTGGLIHLFSRVVLYKKLPQTQETTRISQIGQSTLKTSKTFPRIFNDDVFKRCQFQPSFEACVSAHNQSIQQKWKKIKNDPTAVEKMWLSCRDELSQTELQEVAWMYSKWNGNSKGTEQKFWISQIDLFEDNLPAPYFAQFHAACGGPSGTKQVWYKMFGVVSRGFYEMARLEKLPISTLLPSKDSENFVWPASLKEFTKQTGIELTETEYKIFKDFFTQRLKFLNQELQFSERRLEFEDISKLSFETIGLSLSDSKLRAFIATKEEVDALTVEDGENLSKSELQGLLERYQGYCYPASDVSIDNVDQVKLHQLRGLSGQKFEKIFPLLPQNLILFFDNVSQVSPGFLRTNFYQFFSRKLTFQERISAETRLKNLTSEQANHLLDLLDDYQFSLLTDQVIEKLDVNALRTNFERLFPKVKGLPFSTPDSYEKMTFKIFDSLVDKFDENRLASIDFEILQAMDKSKFSSQQLKFLKSLNVPSF